MATPGPTCPSDIQPPTWPYPYAKKCERSPYGIYMVVLIVGVAMCVLGKLWQWVSKKLKAKAPAPAPGDKDVPFYKLTWYQIAIILMIIGAIGMSASTPHNYEEYPCMSLTKSADPEEMVTDFNNDYPRKVDCNENPCDMKKYCKLK
jgi:hypothetical protein